MSYIFYFGDPMGIEVITQEMNQKRQLLATIYSGFARYLFSTIAISNSIYFCLIGRKLVKLLDDNCFTRVYCNVSAKLIFYTTVTFLLVSFLGMGLLIIITRLNTNDKMWILIANILISYPINSGMAFGIFVNHYVQYGNKAIFANIETSLNGQNSLSKSK